MFGVEHPEEQAIRDAAVGILTRNTTRDYVEFAVLTDEVGAARMNHALRSLETLCPQSDGKPAFSRLMDRLAHPHPCDFRALSIAEYKQIDHVWNNWRNVTWVCSQAGMELEKRRDLNKARRDWVTVHTKLAREREREIER